MLLIIIPMIKPPKLWSQSIKLVMKIMLLVKPPNIMNVEGIAAKEEASEAKGVAKSEIVVSEKVVEYYLKPLELFI